MLFRSFKHHFNIYKSCTIIPAVFTDHSLVLCQVFIRNVKPKSAYWHFNSALTFDRKFREVFIYFWDVFRQRKNDFFGGTMARPKSNFYVNSTPSMSLETSLDL